MNSEITLTGSSRSQQNVNTSGGRHAWLAAMAMMTVVTLCGCGSSQPDIRGERVSVSGQVLLDGQPLSRATILFISDQGSGAVKASGTVEAGAFTISSAAGPLPGSARVEIHPEIVDLEEFEAARSGDRYKQVEARPVTILPRYNIRSELTAQLSSEEANDVRFELSSR